MGKHKGMPEVQTSSNYELLCQNEDQFVTVEFSHEQNVMTLNVFNFIAHQNKL